MKKLLFNFFTGLLVLIGAVYVSESAWLENVPQTIKQPDGTILHCYASGDEFFNRLHDKNGYTIMQDPETGYYVYAKEAPGTLVPTKYIPGRDDPEAAGLKPNAVMPKDYILKKRNEFEKKMQIGKKTVFRTLGEGQKTMVYNLVVFIRFADDPPFDKGLDFFENMLNAGEGNSVNNYYKTVTYGNVGVKSYFYPTPQGNQVISYQDKHPRSYYQPYNKVLNQDGYKPSERGYREYQLLQNALAAIADEVPAGMELDGNGDSTIDNISFIVYGPIEGWSDLLWPHASRINYKNKIGGFKTDRYNLFLTEGGYLLTRVFCHEFFHTLGAPDLYHYSYDGFSPTGKWDIMCDNANPPSSMCAYMKYRYGGWIKDIPLITEGIEYKLKSLFSPDSNCYMIKSPVSDDEYFVVEYRRNNESIFDSGLPGSGLLVYRINKNCTGNRNGPPDEVYLYRPGETLTIPVDPDSAYFSLESGRTAIDGTTDPNPFLTSGAPGYLKIYDIGSPGETISFKVTFNFPVDPPQLYLPGNKKVDVALIPSMELKWHKAPHAEEYTIQVSEDSNFTGQVIEKKVAGINSLTLTDKELSLDKTYFWRVKYRTAAKTSDWSDTWKFTTEKVREGIFIWDNAVNKNDYNAEFIADFIRNQGLKVNLSRKFPNSLEGYDAAFLIMGSFTTTGEITNMRDPTDSLIADFLENGGSVYLEFPTIRYYSMYFLNDTTRFFKALGLKDNMLTYEYYDPEIELKGTSEGIFKSMIFNTTNQSNFFYFNLFAVDNNKTIAAFINGDSSISATQYSGDNGSKAIVMNYALSSLVDGDYPSTRYEMIYRILKYFGCDENIYYYMPEISWDKNSGPAPLTVNFHADLKTNDIEKGTTYQWDFDNDGVIDSEEKDPEFTYNEPGIYSVKLKAEKNGKSYEITLKDTVFVFENGSAVEFSPMTFNYVKVPLNEKLKLNSSFTFESWIYPTGLGAVDFNHNTSGGGYKNGTIFNYKNIAQLYFPNFDRLCVLIMNADGTGAICETPRQSIKMNEWQHVAMTYDGMGGLKVYINGVSQEIRFYGGQKLTSGLFDSENFDNVYIGNGYGVDESVNLSFEGKIDEVRLWDRVLSDEELAFNKDKMLFGNEEGLVGYWRFDDGYGDKASDFTGNGGDAYVKTSWKEGVLLSEPVSVNETLFPDKKAFAYPNPFSSSLNFMIDNEAGNPVSITLYNALGEKAAETVTATNYAGMITDGLPAGVYFYVIRYGQNTINGKVLLAK